MSDNDKTTNRKARTTDGDAGQREAQQLADQATEQGFVGRKVDETPNENYTVAGVTSGAPTPETDPKLAEQTGSRRFAGGTVEDRR